MLNVFLVFECENELRVLNVLFSSKQDTFVMNIHLMIGLVQYHLLVYTTQVKSAFRAL